MIIKECYIESFGKISNEKFVFTEGLNKILAGNGEGKTTLSVFIKCMLYGMSDTKKLSLDENERKRYLPWSGAPSGGSLTFSSGGRDYRIERRFATKASEDSFKLYDTALGRESEDFSERVGEELFGVDAESFERTLFLSERALSPKNSNKTISAKLSELVGCDGDISSMDGALKLLEEQRKIYAKKGGSGEISDLKAEISRLCQRLSEIDKCEERMKETEDRLAALTVRERELRLEEQGNIRERESLAKRAGESAYKNTLADMRTRLAAMEKRRGELIDFFSGSIPSEASIERAKAQEAEIKRLKSTSSVAEDEELTALNDYFRGKASPGKIEEIKSVYDRLRLGAYEDSDNTKRRRRLFAKRTPERSEIEESIRSIRASIKKPVLPTVILLLGMFLSLIGIVLGVFVSPMFSILAFASALSAILVPVFINSKHKKEMKKIRETLATISDEAAEDRRDPLIIYEEMLRLLSAGEDENPLIKEDRRILTDFASLFGKRTNVFNDIGEILEKYERLKELSAVERYKSEIAAKAADELKYKSYELDAFLKSFKCRTDDPLQETAVALAEYNRLAADIVERRRDLENLTSGHKADNLPPVQHTQSELDARSAELTGLFSEITRERALLDRQYRADSSCLEEREELLSLRDELSEKLLRYSDNLEIIKLTKKYLEAARDSMHTKYLGKTLEAFGNYAEMISGSAGIYEMDTDFGVTKLEGARAHSTEAYSRGMRDIYNLAGRFALIDSLYEKDEPFVILDDPFAALDDKKCAAALSLLDGFAEKRQIIYFTCSKSRI